MFNSELSIDGNLNPVTKSRQPVIVLFFAHFFSYVFHPLFIPFYVSWFIEFIHPSYFSGFSDAGKKRVLVMVTINAIAFPFITVILLKALGFIDSFFLRTQRDRIIPYIASMTFFFWAQYALREQPEIPRILVAFMFGVFISSAAALIANIYFKVSMHAIGMGGLTGIFFVIMQQNSMLMTWPLSAALLIAGLVCTSRLIVSDHNPKDIYSGLLIGFICQLIGASIQL
jgi:hypothetical protein